MAKGKALIIGLNRVDAEQYQGWEGPLNCAENDANAIAGLAAEKGFENTLLLTADATKAAVKNTILAAAEELQPGDMFFMYYSGHGNSVKDRSGDEGDDGKDETLCLYDNQMLDDELYALWPKFAPGVRVLVLADCCHSGSITRNAIDDDLVVKAMDERSSNRVLRRDPEKYKRMRQGIDKQGEIAATVQLISGCQDHQQSFESKSRGHGQMTAALLGLMAKGSATSYVDAHAKILAEMPDFQQPNYLVIGAESPEFQQEAPFTI
ncbi:MAG: caspase family protein [Pseudomonadales bacterium]